MKSRGVSAAQLARDTQLANSVPTQWKQGKQKPSLDAIVKIAAYFGVSADYLLGLTDNPAPPKKEYTTEDKLSAEIAKLSPDKRRQAAEFVEFLKRKADFTQELSDSVNSIGKKPQMS